MYLHIVLTGRKLFNIYALIWCTRWTNVSVWLNKSFLTLSEVPMTSKTISLSHLLKHISLAFKVNVKLSWKHFFIK